MQLDRYEEEMAAGKHGPGKQKCMEILMKFGKAMGATRFVKISSAHTMPKEPLELLEELTEGVEEIGTFTTLHPTMSAFCLRNWKNMGISEDFAAKELPIHERRRQIYKRLGIYQTYTCLPMLVGNIAQMNHYVSWIGTGLQLLTNSVLGARTNRDGTVVNLASAITGRTPYYGFLQEENRKAEIVITFVGLENRQLTSADLGAIGYYVGAKAREKNVVFSNIPERMGFDELRYLLPPLSVSGSVGICHVVGVTPEAPTLNEALGHKPAIDVMEVGPKEIDQAKSLFIDSHEEVDMALFGCSHCTINEIGAIARNLEGKRLDDGKILWLGTSYQTYELASEMGYTDAIEKAGGVFANACMATIPESNIPKSVKTLATNSFKAAHYISRLSKGAVKVCVADTEDCLNKVRR